MCLCLAAGIKPVWAYRPFDGTDPAVADVGKKLSASARRTGLLAGNEFELKGTTMDGKPFDIAALKGKVIDAPDELSYTVAAVKSNTRHGKNFTQDEPALYGSPHTRSSSCSFVNTYLFLLYLSLLFRHVECHIPLGCHSCFLSLCVCSSGGYTSQSRSHSTSRHSLVIINIHSFMKL